MKDKLRELAERWKTSGGMPYTRASDQGYASGLNGCAAELLAILDAEGDGGAVDSMRALLIKALTNYRCNRTVDEDGEPLSLVDVLSPGEGGTIKPGIEEIEFLAECLADELPTLHTHPARSGVEDGGAVDKLCPECGTHEVEFVRICHNSSCSNYAKELTFYEGWRHVYIHSERSGVVSDEDVRDAVNVPDGYVLTPIDERTGICTDAQRWLLKRDLDTLISFHMQCDDMDADGYTAAPSEMARLAEIGVVRKVRGPVYEVTSIGCFLCENYWGQNPQLPVMTAKDYNERSANASIDAAIQGERNES